jgi:hypothetical protein
MAATEMTLPNLSEDPLWQILQQELINLLDELTEDPKYREHVTLIRALLAHPRCLKVEQLYFVPQTRPWPHKKRS